MIGLPTLLGLSAFMRRIGRRVICPAHTKLGSRREFIAVLTPSNRDDGLTARPIPVADCSGAYRFSRRRTTIVGRRKIRHLLGNPRFGL